MYANVNFVLALAAVEYFLYNLRNFSYRFPADQHEVLGCDGSVEEPDAPERRQSARSVHDEGVRRPLSVHEGLFLTIFLSRTSHCVHLVLIGCTLCSTAIVFAYDFYPGAETLMQRHFSNRGAQQQMNGFSTPFNADAGARSFSAAKRTKTRDDVVLLRIEKC